MSGSSSGGRCSVRLTFLRAAATNSRTHSSPRAVSLSTTWVRVRWSRTSSLTDHSLRVVATCSGVASRKAANTMQRYCKPKAVLLRSTGSDFLASVRCSDESRSSPSSRSLVVRVRFMRR